VVRSAAFGVSHGGHALGLEPGGVGISAKYAQMRPRLLGGGGTRAGGASFIIAPRPPILTSAWIVTALRRQSGRRTRWLSGSTRRRREGLRGFPPAPHNAKNGPPRTGRLQCREVMGHGSSERQLALLTPLELDDDRLASIVGPDHLAAGVTAALLRL